MVHSAPLNKLDLVAASAADDAGFVALHDVAKLVGHPEFEKSLVIGGHMVSLHVQRWGLSLPRQTQDTDLGIPQLALNTTNIGPVMDALGYKRIRSNRFAKRVIDTPSDQPESEAIVDVLVPALTSHPRKNVKVGDVTTIEVMGLGEALNRPRVVVDLKLTLRNKKVLAAAIKIADERSALILKTMAWNARTEGKDAVDMWRCLEIANAAALGPSDFNSDDGARMMTILQQAFGSEKSSGAMALASSQGLSQSAMIARMTRIRALIQKLQA